MQFDLADAIQILRRTPAVLRELLSDLPSDWTRANVGPDTWSAFDIVGHLIDGEEEDWIVRARIILERGDNRTFVPFDRFSHLERNKDASLESLLNRFAELRAHNLQTLREMDVGDDQLKLTGEHPALGTVTLEQLLATWVVHDLGHIAQIARVMSKQYAAEVGPWAAYLPVLHR